MNHEVRWRSAYVVPNLHQVDSEVGSGLGMNLPECPECRASIADYVDAYRSCAREMLESGLAGDEQLLQDLHRARMLRTEEDVVLAEALFPAIQFKSSVKIGLALKRMMAHEARTGHKVRNVIRQVSGK